MADTQWHVYHVFHQAGDGDAHESVGTVHAPDHEMALMMARDVFVRRFDCVSLWVVREDYIHSTNPAENEILFNPALDKTYRYPGYYQTKTQQMEIIKEREKKENN